MRPTLAAGLDRDGAAERDAGGRGAQRARLRVLGPRGQAQPAGRCMSSPACAAPQPLTTAYTISLGTPEAMARAAAEGGRPRRCSRSSSAARGDPERIARGAARGAARRADRRRQRGLDAPTISRENLAACAAAGVTLIEQPLPAGRDDALGAIARADPGLRRRERARPRLARRARRQIRRGQHQARQDRRPDRGAGAWRAEAERLGFALMVGCMVATSLAMAPAMLLAQRARVVDLDGPLLLARDRPRRGCATRAAWSTRRRRRCGADRLYCHGAC